MKNKKLYIWIIFLIVLSAISYVCSYIKHSDYLQYSCRRQLIEFNLMSDINIYFANLLDSEDYYYGIESILDSIVVEYGKYYPQMSREQKMETFVVLKRLQNYKKHNPSDNTDNSQYVRYTNNYYKSIYILDNLKEE
jgi:hypothetical protein